MKSQIVNAWEQRIWKGGWRCDCRLKIENAREEGMGTEGWREEDGLNSQIENAGEEGMGRGVQRGEDIEIAD